MFVYGVYTKEPHSPIKCRPGQYEEHGYLLGLKFSADTFHIEENFV